MSVVFVGRDGSLGSMTAQRAHTHAYTHTRTNALKEEEEKGKLRNAERNVRAGSKRNQERQAESLEKESEITRRTNKGKTENINK